MVGRSPLRKEFKMFMGFCRPQPEWERTEGQYEEVERGLATTISNRQIAVGMDREELAAATALSVDRVEEIKAGNEPSRWELSALANALRVTVAELKQKSTELVRRPLAESPMAKAA